MEPIQTRVGQIVEGDNRFLGRSVYEEWVKLIKAPSDAVLLALGINDFSENHRESIRLVSLGAMSPDARVWPLKLTRLISSWGDPIVGYFGAQLVTAGRVMGPGSVTAAARLLSGIAQEVGESPSLESVAEALKRWRQRDAAPLGGFGVPFRPVDERRVALIRFVGDGPLSQRRYWKLHQQVVACLAPLAPNCALTIAALLLDTGILPERCGLALSALMQHVFLAHALEASVLDGARLNAWGPEQVSYQGVGPRVSHDGQRGEIHPALQRATS